MKKMSVEEFFQDANNKSRTHIKEYIIKNNLIKYECSNCGCDGHWLNGIISLELHHINGVNNDNSLENLTFLCPNCHALTENYGNKKIEYKKKISFCPICSKEMNRDSKTCLSCKNKLQEKFTITREELKEKIRKYPWREIGSQYSVSDSAIKKRCKKFNLPITKKEINSYSDEEWNKI